MRFFLGAHRAGLALVGIEKPRFLINSATVFDNLDLPARLIFNRLSDEIDRVHILDLAASAERPTRPAHRDVDVGTQRALLHVTVAGAEIAKDRAQLRDICLGLLRRADIGLRYNFHQGDAGPVEVHIRHRRAAIVQ